VRKKRLILGYNKDTGRPVYIDEKERATHMQVIGSTGEGKSKFLEHMIRQDIINGNGLCLIDPHGHLYNDLVTWCASKRLLDRGRPKRIVLFDPAEEKWTFGFNPLQADLANLAFHVDAMVKAVAKVWGGENQDQTPLLKRCLRVLFHALGERQLSLLEAQHLVNPIDGRVRGYLTHELRDKVIQQEWDYFNRLKPRPFYEEFGSTINRMMEFLSSPIIRSIIGQLERVINFRKVMDEGWVLLVNLAASDRISEDNARLLGTLIVNDLFLRAKGRKKDSRPFYLYIDECALFINEDIGRILDEGRKFGLHQILAHQHLAQLKQAGEAVYHSVMTDAKTKVVFGGLDTEDARVLAEQLFLGELDMEEAKVKFNKPVVVGYIRSWLKGYMESRSRSAGSGRGSGRAGGQGYGSSESVTTLPAGLLGDELMSMQTGSSGFTSEQWSESDSRFEGESEGEAWSEHETLEPLLEERPTKEYSLEEQIYKAMALMVNQPQRHAIIKLPKKKALFTQTPFVKEGYARAERVRSFKEQCFSLTDFVQPRALIEDQLARRSEQLENEARLALLPPEEPESFRE